MHIKNIKTVLKNKIDGLDWDDIFSIITDIIYLDNLEYFERYTLPSMINNRYAPGFGWDADFKDKVEYLVFINKLYGKDDVAEEYIIDYITYNIESFYNNKEELQEDIEWFGDIKDVAYAIFEKLSLREIIDIISIKVEEDIDKGKIDVRDYFEQHWLKSINYYPEDISFYKNNPDELLKAAEKYGLYESLINFLETA